MPETPHTPQAKPHAKVAISSILMATSLAAVLLAGMRTIGEKLDSEAIPWAIGGLVAGLLAAGAFLAAEPRTTKEDLAGLFIGAVFGPLAGVFLAYPTSLPTLAAGAVVLVLSALVVRHYSAR